MRHVGQNMPAKPDHAPQVDGQKHRRFHMPQIESIIGIQRVARRMSRRASVPDRRIACGEDAGRLRQRIDTGRGARGPRGPSVLPRGTARHGTPRRGEEGGNPRARSGLAALRSNGMTIARPAVRAPRTQLSNSVFVRPLVGAPRHARERFSSDELLIASR